MLMTVNEIIKAIGADVIQKGKASEITSVSIDTRVLKKGDLFIAIKGPHFDGHDFVEQAVSIGAVGIIRNQKTETGIQRPNVWILEVKNTIIALGDFAAAWRKKLKSCIIAITGSNGKSTTKEMIAAGLAETSSVVKTEGNFNNLIGLPLQALRADKTHDFAVFEMGMNAPGEIKRLTEIANPNIGLITNVNPAHLEKLHTVENVAKAKGELFETMSASGTAVINAEDEWTAKLGGKFGGKKIYFGMQNQCDVRFGHMISEGLDKTDLTFCVGEREYAMRLPVPGVHNVMNALAAVAVGLAAGVAPATMIPGIEKFSTMKMRMERVQLMNGVQLINDCYNANPSSMQAALRTVGAAKRAGRFIAVLGDMLELGQVSSAKHRELGEMAAGYGVLRLFVTGQFAEDVADGARGKGLKNITVAHDFKELEKRIIAEIKTGDVVLVKGSRGMKMEQVVEFLKNEIGA